MDAKQPMPASGPQSPVMMPDSPPAYCPSAMGSPAVGTPSSMPVYHTTQGQGPMVPGQASASSMPVYPAQAAGSVAPGQPVPSNMPAYPLHVAGSTAPAQPSPYPAAAAPVVSLVLGEMPQLLVCPHCGTQVQTDTQHVAGDQTHLIACVLCCCAPVGLCFLPYCLGSCQDVQHTCPSCHNDIGLFTRMHSKTVLNQKPHPKR
ncbi:LITAF-like zinc ribbon domain-containing protein [Radiomyces spectabilis]|uniref:LITAF-like zinc ribbon domain-containing protein n=1 Tax=Radiomyces spectabilis TaxID=64574 RepID=UPI00221FA015|nr:LITAF-like zinc ribbon domain-containing protein [Radiomyces spectabilis]KAI8374642.1 LITAF-like zinc ribbon domain-containing protein [Radiomyces spectabilis]